MLALDGLNLYAYCANDPVDYYDPSGYYKNPVEESRRAAFRHAKRDAGINVSSQPVKVERVKYYDEFGEARKGKNGQLIWSRQYYYKNNRGETIIIQEHQDGHVFVDGKGTQGPDFNVRPENNPHTGTVEGALKHYGYKRR